MHNLHIAVTADSEADDAMQTVDDMLASWGNENNWSSVVGAIGEDGTYHPGNADSRYAGAKTLEEINGLLKQTVRMEPEGSTLELMGKVAEGGLSAMDAVREKNRSAAYRLLSLCEHVYALDCAGLLGAEGIAKRNGPLSVFTQAFRPWEFAEFGVTHLNCGTGTNGEKKYAVLVDMHS